MTLTKCRNDFIRTPCRDVSDEWRIPCPSGHRAYTYGEEVRESIWDIGVSWVAVYVDDVGQDGWWGEFHETQRAMIGGSITWFRLLTSNHPSTSTR